MTHMITTKCYNKVKTFKTAKAAIKYFTTGLNSCDPESSEAERYRIILTKIDMGLTDVDDTEPTIEEIMSYISRF